mmetsp:Transcript_66722/g.214988  ORF Transcript_66722/g.214988 Transcript_66722/m.214988 type:complete len:243 (-) Transcript_66722:1088-1816(-)
MPYITRLPVSTERMLMMRPARTKSPNATRFVAKTTELGGVAAGSMKAKEQAAVAGSISANGCLSVSMATPSRIGSMMLAVTVLEVTSVRKQTQKTMRKVSPSGSMFAKPAIFSPTQAVSLETLKPSASAKPPPMRRSTPQGRCFCATSQVSTVSPGRFAEGRRKSATAAVQAMVSSPTPERSTGSVTSRLLVRSLRVSHPKIWRHSMDSTTISSRLMGPSAAYSRLSTPSFSSTDMPRTKRR